MGTEGGERASKLVRPRLFATLLGAAFAYLVWPTPWAYWSPEECNKGGAPRSSSPPILALRRNRITGAVYRLTMQGWVGMDADDDLAGRTTDSWLDALRRGRADERALAATALAEHGLAATTARADLFLLLDDDNPRVRDSASRALAAGGRDLASQLATVACDPTSRDERRIAALRAIGMIGADAAAAVPLLMANWPSVTGALAESMDDAVARVGASAIPALVEQSMTEAHAKRAQSLLLRVGGEAAGELLGALAVAYDSVWTETGHRRGGAFVTWETLESARNHVLLKKLGHPGQVAIYAGLADPREHVRHFAAHALAAEYDLAQPDFLNWDEVDRVLSLLADASERVRRQAVIALRRSYPGTSRESGVLAAVVALLRDKSPGVRVEAAATVMEFDPANGDIPATLLGVVRDSKEPAHRSRAVELLASNPRLGRSVATEARAWLDDAQESLRLPAAECLVAAGAGSPSVVSVLCAVLQERREEGEVRRAVKALATMGPAAGESLPALRRLIPRTIDAQGRTLVFPGDATDAEIAETLANDPPRYGAPRDRRNLIRRVTIEGDLLQRVKWAIHAIESPEKGK